jgi:hypothetical protein
MSYHRLVVPTGVGEKALQSAGGDGERLGYVLGVAAFLGLHQQALEIRLTVLALLLATEVGSELRVEGAERAKHTTEIFDVHRTPPEGVGPSGVMLPGNPDVVILEA